MKKTILMILALWLVISLIPAAAATEVPVRTQYQCGEYIYWAFDEATGTLTIGGQGLMDDYGPGETPWASFQDEIQTVVFGGGVSYVGSYSFYDCDSITQVDFARHAAPSSLPVHPDSPLYDRSLAAELAYDPEELMAQLTDLNLEGRALTVLVNSENTARVAAAERIAGQLRSTGLKVTLDKLAFEDYTLALEQGKFDLYLGEVVLTADFDLSSLLLPGAPLNYGRWSDAAVSPLLSMYRASEGTQRSINARLMYGHLAQEVPIAPIAFKNGCVLTRWGRLSGLNPVRGNVFYHLEGWNII